MIGAIIAVMLWSITILPEKDYLPYGNTNMVFMLIEPVAGVPAKTNMKYFAPYEDKNCWNGRR